MTIKMTTPYGTLEFNTPDEAAAYTSALAAPSEPTQPEEAAEAEAEVEPPTTPITDLSKFRRKSEPRPQLPVTSREMELVGLLRSCPEAQPGGEGVRSSDLAHCLEWTQDRVSATLNKLHHDDRGVERISNHWLYRLTPEGRRADLVLAPRPMLYLRREEA
jgi:hypothetical protein